MREILFRAKRIKDGNGLYDLNKCYYIYVVGNIFDNPELLGKD